jgi:hypothetical protein
MPRALNCIVTSGSAATIPSRICSLKVTEFMPQRKSLGGGASKQQQPRQGHKQSTSKRKGPDSTSASKPQQAAAEQKLKASAGCGSTWRALQH